MEAEVKVALGLVRDILAEDCHATTDCGGDLRENFCESCQDYQRCRKSQRKADSWKALDGLLQGL